VIARRAASVILAGALALGMSGCSFIATQATLIPYQPSDGIGAQVGDVKARNVLGLSADGTDVAIVMTLVNSGERTIVNLQYTDADGEKQTEAIFANEGTTSIGNLEDDKLVLSNVDVTVGGRLAVYLQTGSAQGEGILVPVMDGTLPEYEPLLPPVAEAE